MSSRQNRLERLYRYDIARYGATARQSSGRRRQIEHVGEKALVNPGVTLLQFLGRHVFRAEDRVRRVVQGPIAVQQPPLGFHLPEQRRRRIRSKNVKRCALQAVLLDPFGGAGENVFPVVIESQHERTIHLDAVIVQHAHAARIVGGLRSFLPGVGQILIGERLEPHEYAGASGQRHARGSSSDRR